MWTFLIIILVLMTVASVVMFAAIAISNQAPPPPMHPRSNPSTDVHHRSFSSQEDSAIKDRQTDGNNPQPISNPSAKNPVSKDT